MYWNISVSLKWILILRTDSLLNFSPLLIVVSKKLASETVIPAVNSIVGWCLFFFSNRVVDDIFVGVQERDYVSDVVFPNERFGSTFIEDLRSLQRRQTQETS